MSHCNLTCVSLQSKEINLSFYSKSSAMCSAEPERSEISRPKCLNLIKNSMSLLLQQICKLFEDWQVFYGGLYPRSHKCRVEKCVFNTNFKKLSNTNIKSNCFADINYNDPYLVDKKHNISIKNFISIWIKFYTGSHFPFHQYANSKD